MGGGESVTISYPHRTTGSKACAQKGGKCNCPLGLVRLILQHVSGGSEREEKGKIYFPKLQAYEHNGGFGVYRDALEREIRLEKRKRLAFRESRFKRESCL